ncbi:MAG: hypothetical protein ACJAR2_000576 [Ilumatobacter sp.]|jgi:hypothetical protein
MAAFLGSIWGQAPSSVVRGLNASDFDGVEGGVNDAVVVH